MSAYGPFLRGRRTVGLLGGSFNPAHEGHLHLSRIAYKRLGLDEVWWLVTPHNPHKKREDLEDYYERVATAKQLSMNDFFIRVSTFEADAGSRYTVETIRKLHQLYPEVTFIWLMGADNLVNFHRWESWEEIVETTPVAVIDRAPFTHKSMRSVAATRYIRSIIPENAAKLLKRAIPPAWVFLHPQRADISATSIRKKHLGKSKK